MKQTSLAIDTNSVFEPFQWKEIKRFVKKFTKEHPHSLLYLVGNNQVKLIKANQWDGTLYQTFKGTDFKELFNKVDKTIVEELIIVTDGMAVGKEAMTSYNVRWLIPETVNQKIV